MGGCMGSCLMAGSRARTYFYVCSEPNLNFKRLHRGKQMASRSLVMGPPRYSFRTASAELALARKATASIKNNYWI